MVSKCIGSGEPFAIASPDDAMVMETALRILHCLNLSVRAAQAIVRPKRAPEEAHAAKVNNVAFEEPHRSTLCPICQLPQNLFPAPVIPFMVPGDVQNWNRPIFKQVNGHATEADVAGEHKHVRTVSRSNEALAKELPGQKFEVEVRSQLNAHRLRHQESVRASHPDTQEYG